MDATGNDADATPPDAGANGDADAFDAEAAADSSACNATLLVADAAGPDGDLICNFLLPCGLSPGPLAFYGCNVVLTGPDGGPIPDAALACEIVEGCDGGAVPPDSSVAIACDCNVFFGCGGRRPAGARRGRRRHARDPVAAYLAHMAREEALSVEAFQRMRAELEALDAPVELIRAAGRSCRDEVRHARMMARLARARGAKLGRLRRSAKPFAPRTLEAVARENVVEGCVRETFGALCAHWQARRAADPELRRAYAGIAADETRHAALAWAFARWATRRLDRAARRRVARSGRAALRALQRGVSTPLPNALVREAGLPARAAARALGRSLFRCLPLEMPG